MNHTPKKYQKLTCPSLTVASLGYSLLRLRNMFVAYKLMLEFPLPSVSLKEEKRGGELERARCLLLHSSSRC